MECRCWSDTSIQTLEHCTMTTTINPAEQATEPKARKNAKGKKAKFTGRTKAEAAEAKKASKLPAIPTLKKGALSTDVGPLVISEMAKVYDQEAKAQAMLAGVESKRYDLLAKTTQAIVKAAQNDDAIDLAAAFGDKKGMIALNNQLRLALGIVAPVQKGKGDKAVTVLETVPEVARYFPGPKDKKGTVEYDRKHTLRTNFVTQLKKCAQAAHTIITKNIDINVTKEGTLLLEGKAVEKEFGAPSVLLNEKQMQGATKLTQKPSFTAVAAMSAPDDKKDKVGRRGVGTGAKSHDTNAALVAMCDTLVAALSKLGNAPDITDAARTALASAESAINKVLKSARVVEAA
jgi:hypothetical protein